MLWDSPSTLSRRHQPASGRLRRRKHRARVGECRLSNSGTLIAAGHCAVSRHAVAMVLELRAVLNLMRAYVVAMTAFTRSSRAALLVRACSERLARLDSDASLRATAGVPNSTRAHLFDSYRTPLQRWVSRRPEAHVPASEGGARRPSERPLSCSRSSSAIEASACCSSNSWNGNATRRRSGLAGKSAPFAPTIGRASGATLDQTAPPSAFRGIR